MSELAKKRQEELAREGKGAPGTPATGEPPEADQPPAPPPEETPPEPPAPPKPEVTLPDPGACSGCGEPLKWTPVNSRVRAAVCTNVRCNLYRERAKVFSLPKPKPKPAPKNSKKKGASNAGTGNRQGGAKEPQKGRR